MRRSSGLFWFTLALGAALPAQTSVTSPAGYLSKESNGYSPNFGGDSFGRVMFFDGELRNSAMAIKEVAYRPDVAGTNWRGRTWWRVTIDISECDLTRASTIFSANPTSTPTRVFRASTSWPSHFGKPSGAWTVRFPFTSSWAYRGTTDICLDYDFEGGTLLNQTGPWWKLFSNSYMLDGYVDRGLYRGVETRFGTTSACVDSGMSYSGFHTYFESEVRTHCLDATIYSGPGVTTIVAMGGFGNPSGVAFPGVTCEKLYLDLAKPVVFLPRIANSIGQSKVRPSANCRIPYDPKIAGSVVWGQAAWGDSVTGVLRLTQASRNTIPRVPGPPRRKELVQPDNVKKYGSGYFPAGGYDVVTRYTR